MLCLSNSLWGPSSGQALVVGGWQHRHHSLTAVPTKIQLHLPGWTITPSPTTSQPKIISLARVAVACRAASARMRAAADHFISNSKPLLF